jgi:hypothetical protein
MSFGIASTAGLGGLIWPITSPSQPVKVLADMEMGDDKSPTRANDGLLTMYVWED